MNKNYTYKINQYFNELDFEYAEKSIETLHNIFSDDIEIKAILKDLEHQII